MSLINKMLRDLDARHASTGTTVLPDEVRPQPAVTAPPKVSSGVWILVGLALVSALAIQTSANWLPLLALSSPPAANLPPPHPHADPAPPPTNVVQLLPSPEQMLPLPILPETESAPPQDSAEPATSSTTAGHEPAPPQIAESRNTGLIIDRTPPQVSVAKPDAPVVASQTKQAAAKATSVRAAAPARIEKQLRLGTAQERAEAEYRKGIAAYKQGHIAEAATQFKSALQEDPRHWAARQTQLSMLVEQKQWDEVQSVLKDGLDLMPEQIAWAMALARIQVERGKLTEAWETMQKHMLRGEKNADYLGFAGVLLQRMQKPHEATLFYQAAVQLKPNEGRWWLGLGLALEADNRTAEARDAFQHARSASGLTPEIMAVIDRKLR